jgi:hypothetical protein
MGVFVSKNSRSSFFASTVARTALTGGVGFCTSSVDQNRNFENAPNMSLGSNGEDWVRSFRKTQRQVFSLQPWPERPSGAGFTRVLSIETETTKTHQTLVFGETGWIVHFKKTQRQVFFTSNVARTALEGEFRTSFVDRNRNFKNTPNRSYGSNEVHWVRSF